MGDEHTGRSSCDGYGVFMPTPDSPSDASLARAQPTDDIAEAYRDIRQRVASRVVGLGEQVSQISLIGALHAAGGLERGPRVLLLGPSGAGKNTLINGLEYGLQPWRLPWACTSVLGMTAVGWSGAPSINTIIEAALERSPQHPRPVIVIDELHHARLIPGLQGVSAAHRSDLLSNLMDVAGGGVIRLGEGTTEYSCRRALVIAIGAFTDSLDLSRGVVGTADLVRAGIPLELTSRLTEEVIVLPRPSEQGTKEILRNWPALLSLVGVTERMGFSVRIPEESFGRAARAVAIGIDRATLRTAGGWLVSALRSALTIALDSGDPCELVIAPDSLPIPARAPVQTPEDPSGPEGGWDATIMLRPR
jgi:hypothetical protein